MSPVVQIIAGKAVQYSLNNGVSVLEFEDQEFYEVPDYVADGMISRKWAKLAAPGDPGRRDDPGKEKPQPPPVHEPGQQPPKPKPHRDDDDDDGDEEKEHREDAPQHALRTKDKRR